MTALSLHGLRILIVEDNFVVADSLKYLIHGYDGAVTAVAPTLERAFAALAVGTVDVAILDINLRGTSVVPFAEHLRDRALGAEPLIQRLHDPRLADLALRGKVVYASSLQRCLNGRETKQSLVRFCENGAMICQLRFFCLLIAHQVLFCQMECLECSILGLNPKLRSIQSLFTFNEDLQL